MKIKKPLLVFGTPRSGSSLLYTVIEVLCGRQFKMEGLGEFFNVSSQTYWDNGEGITMRPYQNCEPWSRAAGWLFEPIRKSRLGMLSRYPGRYVLKIFPYNLSGEMFAQLRQSHQWLFIERRDLFDQFLSFMVSKGTGVWYAKGGIRIPERSLEVSPSDVEELESHVFHYLRIKRIMRPRHVLIFEDLVGQDGLLDPDRCIRSVARQIGISTQSDFTGAQLTERQNFTDKMRYFRSPRAVRAAYSKSILNQIQPL